MTDMPSDSELPCSLLAVLFIVIIGARLVDHAAVSGGLDLGNGERIINEIGQAHRQCDSPRGRCDRLRRRDQVVFDTARCKDFGFHTAIGQDNVAI